MSSEDDLDRQIARLEKEIILADKRRQLAELLSEQAASPQEQERMSFFREKLIMALAHETQRLECRQPHDPSIEQFSIDWVAQNWASRLRFVLVRDSRISHPIVQEALRELFEQNRLNLEHRGEIVEIQNNYEGSAARTRRWVRFDVFVRRNWPFKVPGDTGSHKKGYGKRADELRDERRHHRIQRRFSAWSWLFSGFAAIFMTLMLCVGVLQLFSAAAQGMGFSWHLNTAHVATSEGSEAPHAPPADDAESSLFVRDAHAVPDPAKAMQTSLRALEIILVAPLPYLLILGLIRYIKALAYQERADEFRRELLEFKAFEVALFIAIIAAAVVERVLQGTLKYEFAISVALVMTILASYYFVIETAAKADDKQKPARKIVEETTE